MVQFVGDGMHVQGLKCTLRGHRFVDHFFSSDTPRTHQLTVDIDGEKMPLIDPVNRMNLGAKIMSYAGCDDLASLCES